eukprot:3282317-Prymnesium_polylepis.1
MEKATAAVAAAAATGTKTAPLQGSSMPMPRRKCRRSTSIRSAHAPGRPRRILDSISMSPTRASARPVER